MVSLPSHKSLNTIYLACNQDIDRLKLCVISNIFKYIYIRMKVRERREKPKNPFLSLEFWIGFPISILLFY